MSKKQDTITAQRATADVAGARFRELDAGAKERREVLNAFWRSATAAGLRLAKAFDSSQSFTHNDLKAKGLEIELLEAEKEAEHARVAAVRALHALELAEGDAMTLAIDPSRVHDRFLSLDEEEASLRAQLESVQTRRRELVESTVQAEAEHVKRRTAAGLPTSSPLPRYAWFQSGPSYKPHVEFLKEHIAKGERERDFATPLENARNDLLRIAAQLEERAREKAARERDEQLRKIAREQDDQRERDEKHALEKARNDAIRAEEARKKELAAAYLARHGASS